MTTKSGGNTSVTLLAGSFPPGEYAFDAVKGVLCREGVSIPLVSNTRSLVARNQSILPALLALFFCRLRLDHLCHAMLQIKCSFYDAFNSGQGFECHLCDGRHFLGRVGKEAGDLWFQIQTVCYNFQKTDFTALSIGWLLNTLVDDAGGLPCSSVVSAIPEEELPVSPVLCSEAVVRPTALRVKKTAHPMVQVGESHIPSEESRRIMSGDAIDAYHAKQFEEAFTLFQMLASAGDSESYFYLGRMVAQGDVGPSDIDQAMIHYQKGIEAGNMACAYEAGIQCLSMQRFQESEQYFSSYFQQDFSGFPADRLRKEFLHYIVLRSVNSLPLLRGDLILQQGGREMAAMLETIRASELDGGLFHRAVQSRDLLQVGQLLALGANPNGRNSAGRTPLHLLCGAGSINADKPKGVSGLKVARRLLDAGAEVGPHDLFGFTPVHYAADSSDVPVLDFLLMHGANACEKVADDFTPLHQVVWRVAHTKSMSVDQPGERCVQLLLGYKADPLAPDRHGVTPFHLASLCGHHLLVEAMIKSGAYCAIRTRSGLTPLGAAIFGVRLGLSTACKAIDILGLLFSSGASIQERGIGGMSPLYLAVHCSLPEVVLFLLENGAIVAEKTNTGLTPLDRALLNSSCELVQLLEAYGAKQGDSVLSLSPAGGEEEGRGSDLIRARSMQEDAILQESFLIMTQLNYQAK